jgi:uncharacterized protein (TIGR01244 family)
MTRRTIGASAFTLLLLSLPVIACSAAETEGGIAGDEPGMAPQVAAAAAGEGVETLGIPHLHQPEPGLATGGQITPEQMEALDAMGYEVFVSLRPVSEEGAGWEEEHAEAAGIRFVRIPIAGRDDLNRENAERLAEALAGSGPESPALVYCVSSNRVGALLALEQVWVDGADPDAALEFGRDAGMTRLEGAVTEILGR